MRFTQPTYLLLLLPVLGALIWSIRHLHGMAKGRKYFAIAIRAVLLSLIVIALAGPEAYRPHKGVATFFLLDASDSVDSAERKSAEKFLREAFQNLGEDNMAGLIVFGKEPVVDAAAAGRRDLGTIQSRVDGSASDLAAAIRLASASFPDGKSRRLVLLTDGNETRGDLAGAAEVAAADNLSIDFVPLGVTEKKEEAMAVALEGPSEVRQDQPFQFRAIVDSTVEQNAVIELDRDGAVIARQTVRLNPGVNAILLPQTLSQPGFARYRATLRAEKDRDPRNNIAMGFVAVRGKPRFLVLQQTAARGTLANALAARGITADVYGPEGVPSRSESLQAYDAIILNDFDAANFTGRQMDLIRSAVRDSGVGFAMIGGEHSFLPGGYYGSPIAEILPVDLNIRQRKTFPSTSILIIADCSGSMGMIEDGFPKIRLAAKAAEETVKLMSPMDRVGVGGSTDGIALVAPMQNLTDKGKVIAEIQKLSIAGGGIYIGPTVIEAEQILRKETTKVRHFILLADGGDSTDWRDSFSRTLAMRADKITTTVVAIGDGKDVPELRKLAALGGGRFYLAKKAAQLPAIFTRDAAIMSRSAIEEGAFIPKLNLSDEILQGAASDGVPPLMAYCLTDSRPLSRIGMRTGKDDPLLATWQFGLGTSLAFMSDAQPRWASRWVGWPGFDTFWSQAARSISRRATKNEYQVAVKPEGGRGKLEVKAYDKLGNPLAQTDAKVRVALPDGKSEEVVLSQTAPGQFSGSFEASQLGSYIVSVAESEGVGERVSVSGFSIPYPPEYRSVRMNRPLLEQVAEKTGGKLLEKPGEATRPVVRPGESISELWMQFIFAAALLLPFDIAVRRVALPLGEIFAKAIAFLRRRPAKVEAEASPVGRLHAAKQRVREAQTAAPVEVPAPEPTTPSAREPMPAPKPPERTGPASSALLEARRKRRGE
ncbi:MAG: VWA domain-containing protein [Fimbriimonas sp.]